MNDKMLDIIGLADEKYLHEAEGKPMMKQTKHRRKLSAKIVAVAALKAIFLNLHVFDITVIVERVWLSVFDSCGDPFRFNTIRATSVALILVM